MIILLVIFLATMIENGLETERFCHFQLILSPPPRGLGLKHDTAEIKSFVGIGFSLLVWLTVHVGGLRDARIELEMARSPAFFKVLDGVYHM